MIFTAFYTIGTIYESEAARLRRSLDRLGLRHDLHGIQDRGSWKENTHHTATFICEMLDLHDGPVVYLDADAVVWRQPVMFDDLSAYDLAVHYRKGTELLNGTLWLANTPACKRTIRTYRELVSANPQDRNEQQYLAHAIRRTSPNVYRLPAGMCFIHDLMKDDLAPGEQVFIEHMQASRTSSGSSLLPNRIKRLQELEGKI